MTNIIKKTIQLSLSVFLIFCVTGCFKLTHKLPKNEIVSLNALEASSEHKLRTTKKLLIDDIESAGILDSEKIILIKVPRTFDFFAGYEWSGPAPEMIYYTLKESFENKAIIETVNYDDTNYNPDYMLKLQLRDFQAEYHDHALSKPPVVNIKIYASLVKLPGRNVLVSKTFEEIKKAPENNMAKISETFDHALGNIQEEIISWSVNYIE